MASCVRCGAPFLPVLGEGCLDLQDDGAITPPLGRDAARLRPRRGNIQEARGRRVVIMVLLDKLFREPIRLAIQQCPNSEAFILI